MARLIKMVLLCIKRLNDPYYNGFAAQLSFYFMLSVVPITIIISQILGTVFHTDLQDGVGWLLDSMSNTLSTEIEGVLTYKSAGVFNVIYLIVAFWAASRVQFSLARIANFTMTGGQTTGRGFWRERFRAIGTMFFMLLAIVAGILIVVYGAKVAGMVLGNKLAIWLKLRWIIAFGVFFFVITVVYHWLPTEKVRYRDQLPGALFATVGIIIVTMIYSYYISAVAKYDIIYGALSNVVAMLFWFFFISWMLCLGIFVNKLLIETRDGGVTYD